MKSKLAFIIVCLLFSCEEKKQEFHKELTKHSIPKAGILPYFKSEVMDPYWKEDNSLPSDLRKLSNISLTSHESKIVNSKSLENKYKLLVFFYAKCNSVCPMITSNLINLLPKIKDQSDLEIVSITINPDMDTVEEIKSYKNRYKINQKNWMFLTGNKEEIYDMARTQFGADVKIIKGAYSLNDFVHTENVFLLDKQNYLRGIYRAKGSGDLERLIVELETLRINK